MTKIATKTDTKIVDAKAPLSLKKADVQRLKVRTFLKGGAAKLAAAACGSGCHCGKVM